MSGGTHQWRDGRISRIGADGAAWRVAARKSAFRKIIDGEKSRSGAVKRAWQSKLNWLGLCITLLGLFVDPTFQGYLRELLPPEILSRVVSGAGILVMILRTCCTSEAIGKEQR
jgi:hypothetical protein